MVYIGCLAFILYAHLLWKLVISAARKLYLVCTAPDARTKKNQHLYVYWCLIRDIIMSVCLPSNVRVPTYINSVSSFCCRSPHCSFLRSCHMKRTRLLRVIFITVIQPPIWNRAPQTRCYSGYCMNQYINKLYLRRIHDFNPIKHVVMLNINSKMCLRNWGFVSFYGNKA